MRYLTVLPLLVLAGPAMAASGPFFSFKNTDFVVLCAFVLFLLVLVYFKVPSLLGGMLDKRAEGIKADLDAARALRDEAQALLASYERKQKEAQDQASRIIDAARDDAQTAAEKAKQDLKETVARRLAAAEDQIASAQASAEKEVRDAAIKVAINAASDVIAKKMTAAEANKLIDSGIAEVDAKLH